MKQLNQELIKIDKIADELVKSSGNESNTSEKKNQIDEPSISMNEINKIENIKLQPNNNLIKWKEIDKTSCLQCKSKEKLFFVYDHSDYINYCRFC